MPRRPPRADDLAALVEPGTVISVGGFSGTGARFQGTRAVGLWGLPYASFRKADAPREWFSPDDAVDVARVDAPAIQAGAVLDVRSGRSLHDDRSLAGLPDARSRSRSACSARSGRWTTSCGSAPRSRGGARA